MTRNRRVRVFQVAAFVHAAPQPRWWVPEPVWWPGVPGLDGPGPAGLVLAVPPSVTHAPPGRLGCQPNGPATPRSTGPASPTRAPPPSCEVSPPPPLLPPPPPPRPPPPAGCRPAGRVAVWLCEAGWGARGGRRRRRCEELSGADGIPRAHYNIDLAFTSSVAEGGEGAGGGEGGWRKGGRSGAGVRDSVSGRCVVILSLWANHDVVKPPRFDLSVKLPRFNRSGQTTTV